MGVFRTRRRPKWLTLYRRKWIPFKPAPTKSLIQPCVHDKERSDGLKNAVALKVRMNMGFDTLHQLVY